jgi:hypothetical protein
MASCTGATSPLTNSIRAFGTTASFRCVKTQQGTVYGHVHSAWSFPENSWPRIQSYVVEAIAIAPTPAMKSR